jgi:hypothetical protein
MSHHIQERILTTIIVQASRGSAIFAGPLSTGFLYLVLSPLLRPFSLHNLSCGKAPAIDNSGLEPCLVYEAIGLYPNFCPAADIFVPVPSSITVFLDAR